MLFMETYFNVWRFLLVKALKNDSLRRVSCNENR